MMSMRTVSLTVLLTVLTLAWPAAARITYVDATEGETGNTALATGEVFTSVEDQSGSDNLWRGRVFATNGTIFESGGQYGATNNPEDCPRLMTTVADLPEDDYAVYVYMWADPGPWRIQAALDNSEGDLPLFFCNDPNSPTSVAVATDFEEPVPMLTEGNRTLWQVFVGYTGATTSITVYIDDDPNHLTHEGRTWYDGIGYKPAPPRIVYVDATEGETGNTALATGEVFTSVEDQSGSDNLWRGRVFATNGTIFESGGQYGATANPEDCPRLMTTVIDLPENDYAVYVYMWADPGPWRIQAALDNSEGDLPLFFCNDPNSPTSVAVATDFEQPVPMLTEGNRTLWQVFLGSTGTTTAITVYIDDDPNHLTHEGRTWYDGIGYKIVNPGITYVDATDGETGNTTLATGEVFTPTTDSSGADDLWRIRGGFGNGTTIYEAGGDWQAEGNTEDCPRLMTLTEVPEGYYDVFAYFWSDGGQWRLGASLTDDEGELPLFIANDPNSEATLAAGEDFVAPLPMLAEGNRQLWQIYLGKTNLTTLIQVYIDDEPNHLTGNNRTWYDGIGYKAEE